MERKYKMVAVVVAFGLAAGLAGCSATASTPKASTAASDKGKTITVWSLNEQPNRLAIAQAAAAKFTAKTGIKVKLVGVNEDQFPQLLTTAAAAGTLPDVVGALPLADVRTMSANQLDNTKAEAQIISDLGAKTFSASALTYTRSGSTQLSVPSDGYPISLMYRKDLFAKAGLSAPKTYADVLADAKKLNSSTMAGFVGGDSASTDFTESTFEWLALANGCQLVNSKGTVTLDSKSCQDAFSFYGNLIKNYSIPGANDSTASKTAYMGGKAAMTIWSSFLLPQMAGLDNAIMPTCAQCATDPGFIAKNTGFVTSLRGPDSSTSAQAGDVTSWVVSSTAQASAAKTFVEYMMSTGYLTWLSQAPEGMFPTRNGTAADPTLYSSGWKKLPSGTDRPTALGSLYSSADLLNLQNSVNSFSRWGFSQGQGSLVGSILTSLPIPQAIASLKNGNISAKGAASQAQAAVVAVQNSLK
ncbi:MAG: bicyclomycin resistance protein [Microbacteriaceae bacterium]|jgi:multiple sugar transport system substrate-binding protein|nr:bicyclomycin resistance protein [Microbacteriaceae bacterium]